MPLGLFGGRVEQSRAEFLQLLEEPCAPLTRACRLYLLGLCEIELGNDAALHIPNPGE